MHVLQVGDTAIPYAVSFSSRARRKRIEVTPDGVRVIAPEGTPLEGDDGVFDFVHTKRRWLFDAHRQIAERHRKVLRQRWASGAKLQYRGRWLMLEVAGRPVAEVQIRCRSKFQVDVPDVLQGVERHEAVRQAFDTWLRQRALRDLKRFGRRYQELHGVQAEAFRLSDAGDRWGHCTPSGVVRAHWRLVQAPVAAFEYVVAHEVTHLLHRHHGPEFWSALARVLPDQAERKALLERWEAEHRAV